MYELIQRIRTQLARLQQQYPEAAADFGTAFGLNAGADEADFARLEAVLGYALPDDFKQLYRVANGEIEGSNGLLMSEEWLSIERIIDEYGVWKALYDKGIFVSAEGQDQGCQPEDAGIKADYWWNPRWIPITSDGTGNNKMIDLDPAPAGRAGQIIQMWHDDPGRSQEAESLYALLDRFARDLEAGLYVLDADYGLILAEDV